MVPAKAGKQSHPFNASSPLMGEDKGEGERNKMIEVYPVRKPDTLSTFFHLIDFYRSSSVISNGVKELGAK